MAELLAAGITQLGYVSTYYGGQAMADMKGQVDIYATAPYIAYISGIFFDEVDRFEDTAYYNEIAAYAYAAGLSYVVFNMNGWDQEAVKYFSTPTVNLAVMFEGYPADWQTYLSPSGTSPMWMASYPRTNFAMILLDTSAAFLTTRMQEAYDRNYGVIFITTAGSYEQAYETSPTYLVTEVAGWYTHIGTAAPTATTGPTATSGPYLSPTPTPLTTATTVPANTATATRTATPTNTPFPQATVYAPGEDVAPEGFDSYASAGGHTLTVVTDTVTGIGAWEWNGGAGAGWNRNLWAVPTAYVAYASTPNKSLLISFDIKMVETPTAANIEMLSEWAGGSAGAMILSYNQGSALPWRLITEDGGGTYDWDMTDGAWHRIDIYADQQVGGYAVSKTPAAGEIPFRLQIDGTPIATPTGAPPSWSASGATVLDNWKWYYISDGPFVYRTDNITLAIGACGGSCITPTPAPVPPSADWPDLNCPSQITTVDGNLAEWAAVVPYTLTTTTAAQVWPSTVPVTLTGLFRCAYSGTMLYFSGTITDTTIVSPTGTLANGDAVRIAVDG
ncbi:MAG: spherulation-specific family 4 protein, partial [Gallionella sp.]